MLDVKSQDISIPEAVVVLCTAPDEATAQIWPPKCWRKNWPPAPPSSPARHRCTTGKANWSRSMKFK